MTYAKLTAELDSLLREIENTPDLPLDQLTKKVQRAYVLIGEGRQQLRTSEEAITRVISDFGSDDELIDADDETAPST
jgi:exonuclease VII small subunit